MKIPKSAIVILIAWVVVFILAFVAPRFIAATGDGFTRGLNRVGAFLMWQLGAFCLSIFLVVIAWSKMQSSKGLKWAFSIPLMIHLLLVVFVIGVIVVANFKKPPPSNYEPPATATSTAAPAMSLEQSSNSKTVETFMGIYKSGFEMSHFYTMDGQGPWWLETTDEDHEKLQSYYVERPGRGGGITVAMTVSAYLNEIGPGFNHLAPIDKKIHVVSIDSVRQLSLEEFDQVLATVQKGR